VLFVSANGDGGAAIAASLFCVPAGPDCIVFNSKLWAVGTVRGCGCEAGGTGCDERSVAEGISIGEGLGIVTCGRAGSGITAAVAAVGSFVRLDASRVVRGEEGASSPKTAEAKLTVSQIPTSNRSVTTFVCYSSLPPP
jgi:hypothetical protein